MRNRHTGSVLGRRFIRQYNFNSPAEREISLNMAKETVSRGWGFYSAGTFFCLDLTDNILGDENHNDTIIRARVFKGAEIIFDTVWSNGDSAIIGK
ncbi:hypothetical protein [Aliikangiella sp. IMCC44359]|uniref:hypothetical protein n=1 Tax=Aliikangiella sp. IMCC44359 TaxID=3459125 RepID=UPI00403A9255